MSILHVYDNRGLFNNHPQEYDRRYYCTVYNEEEHREEVVFKSKISGWDLKRRWVSGTPTTVVDGEFIIIH